MQSATPTMPPHAPAELNAAQRAAATYGSCDAHGVWRSGPLLVIAGAGTGKTNTLAHRVAHLVLNGVAPERILLVTFSRRAALELARRARRIAGAALGGAGGGPALARLAWAGTFHSIANRLLRHYAAQLALQPGFSVIDRADAADLMDLARQGLGLSAQARRFPRKDTCLAIYSNCVNTRGSLERTLARSFPWCGEWHDELRRLFGAYVELKLRQCVLDFDDLLVCWHALMQEPALAAEVSARYDHVLVDEYQDTNALQAEILLALKPCGSGLCVVGDDAQSIYSFRAATVQNILEFPQRFEPPAYLIALEENYRSCQPILDAADALIAESLRRYEKRLRASRVGAGLRPRHVSVLDEQAQAEYVIERVLAAREGGVPLRRQAVLFRSAHHSDLLELELVRRNVPYVKYGGLKFLEASHVKDVLAVLRWADNARNRIAAFRTLQLLPGLGPAGARRALDAFEAASHDWSALGACRPPHAGREDWRSLCALLCELVPPERPWPGQVQRVREWYEPHLARIHDAPAARAGDLAQLESVATQFATRERFLSELTLDPPRATGDLAGAPLLDEDYLVLSTIHSAKGQEWDCVHVLNVTDGSFPSEFATGDAEQIEEERRLLYVAMTRARHELALVAPVRYYVTQQSRYGDGYVHGTRSRFLTAAVMQQLDARTWPDEAAPPDVERHSGAAVSVDVAAQLRGRWA